MPVMHVYLHMYMYIVYAIVYEYAFEYLYVYVHGYVYVFMHTYVYVCVDVHVPVYVYQPRRAGTRLARAPRLLCLKVQNLDFQTSPGPRLGAKANVPSTTSFLVISM